MTERGVILAIDAGTTSVRAIAFRIDGSVVCSSFKEFPQYFPRPGWVEHDATEIWQAVQQTIAEVVTHLTEPVITIGITNQRETVVAWDRRTGRPTHRALVWQDRRTAADCAAMTAAGHSTTVRSKTGLPIDPYFSATKMSWLLGPNRRSNETEVALGTIDTWILWKLTGGTEHVTDPSNAARTLLFDIDTCAWDPELCDLFGVPMSTLPEIRPTSTRLGLTRATTALGAGVPISAVVGDQQASLFGHGCHTPGSAKTTYGTGGFVLMHAGDQRPKDIDGILTTIAWSLDGTSVPTYAYEGSIYSVGATVQWLHGLGILRDPSELGPLAESVRTTGDVYIVPAFTGLGSPWWDPNARGTIVGLTRGTGRSELARAAVESMAFQVRNVIDAMTAGSGVDLTELRVDGGVSVIDLLLQLQADQLAVPVRRSTNIETTAVGAAVLAGLGEGVWASCDEAQTGWTSEAAVVPAADRQSADLAYQRWNQAVRRSLNWATGTGT